VKNERRKNRSAAVRLANAFEEETRRFNALPIEERESSIAKEYAYNSSIRLHPTRCTSCGGRGSRERRGRPRAEVPCRVCQGTGWIQRRVSDDAILGLRPSKVYWQGRRWWRHWRR
jgi:DnaJ-class molecular chaperone